MSQHDAKTIAELMWRHGHHTAAAQVNTPAGQRWVVALLDRLIHEPSDVRVVCQQCSDQWFYRAGMVKPTDPEGVTTKKRESGYQRCERSE